MTLFHLLCDYMTSPIGVCRPRPFFSWTMMQTGPTERQTGYRLLIASAEEILAQDRGNIWDSGRVDAYQHGCFYAGAAPLTSCTAYYWKVQIRTQEGWSAFSQPAFFRTALLDPALWTSCWVGLPSETRAVGLFRLEQRIDEAVESAVVYLASNGYAQLWINGGRQAEEYLEPANADFRRRVYYRTYDVTDRLQAGDNVFGVRLGQGWSAHPRFMLQVHLRLKDGRERWIRPGCRDWVCLVSPILSATIYSGEVYNAGYERPGWCTPGADFAARYPRRRWSLFSDYLPAKEEDNPAQYREYGAASYDVVELPAPGGELTGQTVQPIRETGRIAPVSVERLESGEYIVDFGQNFAGVAEVTLSGRPHALVKLQYSEILNEDHTLNMDYLRVSDPHYPLPMQCDQWYLRGEGREHYRPEFTYHGFRYLSISGDIDPVSREDVTGIVLHTDVPQTGRFSCSDTLINQIHRNILWTERSNLHSIPTDCCQRSERQGWLNDLTARAEESVFNFDLNRLYEKFLQDIEDGQDPFSGAIADTAPFRRGNCPADPVCSSYLILCELLYRHYGNIRPIRERYDSMKKWVDYLGRISRDGRLSFSLYGDWASPVAYCQHNHISSPISDITPGDFVSTGYYYMDLRLMERFARLLAKSEEAEAFAERAGQVREVLQQYYDPAAGVYAGGSQGANTLALYLEIVPEQEIPRVVSALEADVEAHDFHVTTGNLMTKYIFEVLTRYGCVDTAYRLITQTTYPSLGYMVEKGATTVWERWEYETGYGMNSHNHPMYGSVGAWFYRYLLGITPLEPGFLRIGICPYPPTQLSYAEGSVDTVAGRVSVAWERQGKDIRYSLTIPDGTEAAVSLPAPAGAVLLCTKQEDKRPDEPAAVDVQPHRADGRLSFTLGSGCYALAVRTVDNQQVLDKERCGVR